jgi:hypothetical protein
MKKQISLCLLLTLLSGAGFSQTDIELTYATFLGGSGEDSGLDIIFANDEESSYLVFGNTTSDNIPITSNAFQESIQGFTSAYFGVFSINGDLEYASYLGGSIAENLSSASKAPDGRIILAGNTSSPDFPLLNASNDQPGEFPSGFITCFNEEYELIWSTYFGGEETDGITDIITDSQGNIYVCGGTSSLELGTEGVHTSLPSAESTSNGFISKLNSDGEIIWYTYVSGTGSSVAEALVLSSDELNLYVSGSVEGNNDHGFIDSYQAEPGGGGRDCILLAYDVSDGTMNWGTYYGGEGFDNLSHVDVLDNENIILTGTTGSDTGIASNGAFQSERAGSRDHFLAAFNPQGDRLWSTYFGGSEMEIVSEVNTSDNSIYLSGGTSSPDIITVGNPILSDPTESFSVASFMARFDQSGIPMWSTYLNENYVCSVTSHFAIAQTGNIYGAGSFNSQGTESSCVAHISSDAFQPDYAGGDSDSGIFHYQENYLSTSFPQAEPLTIYPNPTQDQVVIEAPKLLWAGMELTVTDNSGRLVDHVARFQSGNTYSTDHLSDGVYILTGQIGERMFRQKLVVQR